jgi:hypothetical protein
MYRPTPGNQREARSPDVRDVLRVSASSPGQCRPVWGWARICNVLDTLTCLYTPAGASYTGGRPSSPVDHREVQRRLGTCW